MTNDLARWPLCAAIACALLAAPPARAQPTNVLPPLSRAQAVEIALRQNTGILKGQADLRAAYGVVVQTRAILLPKISAGGNFNANDPSLIEQFPLPAPFNSFIQFPDDNWSADVKIEQSIYEGGRMASAIRAAKLTREQALLNYNVTVADTLLDVRVAYDDALLAAQEIDVHEASVKLLAKELDDARQRFQAGTQPHFNVLRAQVALDNEKPQLIQARNQYRIAKNNLANLLAWDLPHSEWEDVPLQLTDTLAADPWDMDLSVALARALAQRPELGSLRKAAKLRREDLVTAESGWKPSAQLFAGYQWESPPYNNDLGSDLNGWIAGAQVKWELFDGALTRGKIMHARAQAERADLDVVETRRQIELDVRTAHSNFIQAKELLASQQTTQAEAEEALREAEDRLDAGTGTQLDVLDAQTALTQARTTMAQALHDYSVARARLLRAAGEDLTIIRQ